MAVRLIRNKGFCVTARTTIERTSTSSLGTYAWEWKGPCARDDVFVGSSVASAVWNRRRAKCAGGYAPVTTRYMMRVLLLMLSLSRFESDTTVIGCERNTRATPSVVFGS